MVKQEIDARAHATLKKHSLCASYYGVCVCVFFLVACKITFTRSHSIAICCRIYIIIGTQIQIHKSLSPSHFSVVCIFWNPTFNVMPPWFLLNDQQFVCYCVLCGLLMLIAATDADAAPAPPPPPTTMCMNNCKLYIALHSNKSYTYLPLRMLFFFAFSRAILLLLLLWRWCSLMVKAANYSTNNS